MVEYMLSNNNDPVGVATYNRFNDLPKEYAKYLPSEKEIIKKLANLNFYIMFGNTWIFSLPNNRSHTPTTITPISTTTGFHVFGPSPSAK